MTCNQRHFDEGHIDVYVFVCYLAYLTLALFKHHLGTNGWEGVKESLDELGRIRKTTLTLGGEKIDKITVLTKEQKEIISSCKSSRLQNSKNVVYA